MKISLLSQKSILLISLCWTSLWVHAHDARPIVVELKQNNQLIEIQSKVPSSLPITASPQVNLQQSCDLYQQANVTTVRGAYIFQHILKCEKALAGSQVTISFPYFNPSLSVLVKAQISEQETHSALLGPDQTNFVVPLTEVSHRVALSYTKMGMLHIWEGWDHLLFVACLLILAGSAKRIVCTITGFTLGHSVTLVAGALGYVSVPAILFESLIALSIVFMAVELIKKNPQSWAFKYPMLVAVTFGLLHGLGFASVLQDIGLPQVQLFWGLLAFNLGIEVGQLLFVTVLLALSAMWKNASLRMSGQQVFAQQYGTVSIYLIGGLSGYWFWERSLAIFLGLYLT